MTVALHKRRLKAFAVTISAVMVADAFLPSAVYALTGGPSQPEVQSFEPIGTSEMVDLFSGDFVYNIPLLDVGGYPVNLSYHSGAGMDQEASWVGLGWNINAGVINRTVRGMADDFRGDRVVKEFNMKPNVTVGASGSITFELFGKNTGPKANPADPSIQPTLTLGLGAYFNNYKGVGAEWSITPGFSAGDKNKGKMTAGLGLSANSEAGIGISANISYGRQIENNERYDKSLGGSVGVSANSRAGLEALSVGVEVSTQPFRTINTGAEGFGDFGDVRVASGRRAGINGGASFSFSTPTYTPEITMPMTNTNLSLAFKIGGEVYGGHPSGSVTGYYSEQRLARTKETSPAYGYLYADAGQNRLTALHDFNREKEIPFSDNVSNLPVTNFTYDIYSVAGQGVGGMYRPFRSDVGTVYDRHSVNSGDGGSLGLEVGGGAGLHFGGDIKVNSTSGSSGKWTEKNLAGNALKFRAAVPGKPLYEPFFFKQAGEKSVDSDPAFFNDIGRSNAVRVDLDNRFTNTRTRKRLLPYRNGRRIANVVNNIPDAGFARNTDRRHRRNQPVITLTSEEADNFALEKKIRSYPADFFTNPAAIVETKSRTEGGDPQHRKAHHISEITTIRPDGARYVYGLPAYNRRQREVTFAVNGPGNCETGLIKYNAIAPAADNSTSNTKGIDNYFSSVETPAYAHSYLLTAVLSPDYTDRTGDGPTDDDYGTWTKFNYSRVMDDYKWRVPVGENTASFNEGLKSDPRDDKAGYLYGEKEIWYLHSIETKTHIAEFVLADREDGFGVVDEDGACDTGSPLKRLESVSLYARPQLSESFKLSESSVPIKTVHFRYDYSLCPGLPNNKDVGAGDQGSGKLTLTEVFFTYGNSQKGRLSPYVFHYADPDHDRSMDNAFNPPYNLKGYDRWGSFKPNVNVETCNNVTDVGDPSLPLPAPEFPYTGQEAIPSGDPLFDQDDHGRTFSDVYAQAWALHTIDLPSGGTINIDYEADDYAFVQDRRAMQMFTITGSAETLAGNPEGSGLLYGDDKKVHPYLFFRLAGPIPDDAAANDIVRDDYIGNVKDGRLYFRFLLNLGKRDEHAPDNFEFVSGYAQIDDQPGSFGAFRQGSSGPYTHGYIKVKAVEIGDRDDSKGENTDVHPIAKAGWQFTRLHLPELAYGQQIQPPGEVGKNVAKQLVEELAATAKQLGQFFRGINREMRAKEFSKNFVRNKSWIRLHNPGYNKQGGGIRVKKLTISDGFQAMAGDGTDIPGASYGQVYEYRTTLAGGRDISSGVAAYEPLLGGDENPFRQPVFISDDKLLAPDDEHYLEEPFGESHFPAPIVGYSRVTVKNLPRQAVSRSATGKVVHEFYTAKDFPVVTDQTAVEMAHNKPDPVFRFLRVRLRDYMTASQGYVIELNDMHGRQKSQAVFPENDEAAISKVEYLYKTMPGDSRRLNNEVSVIGKDGLVRTADVGLDYDFIADMRDHRNTTVTGGADGNLDAFLAAIFPLAVPVILPVQAVEETRFKSAVTTKVIQRYGVLEKVIATDLGSTVETENVLYDEETGEVLLTRTQNEFEDPVYSFTYPAHWAYDAMGPAYKNTGLSFKNITFTSGVSGTIAGAGNFFVKGDELAMTGAGAPARGWVLDVTGDDIKVMDRDGAPVEGAFDIKVIRSGRRNQQVTPVGTVTALADPLKAGVLTFDSVLNAGAVEFRDDWQTICGFTEVTDDREECVLIEDNAELILDFLDDDNIRNTLFDCTGVGDPVPGCSFDINGMISLDFSGGTAATNINANTACTGPVNNYANTCTACNLITTPTLQFASLDGQTGINNTDEKAALCMTATTGTDPAVRPFAQLWCSLAGVSPCPGLSLLNGFVSVSNTEGVRSISIIYEVEFFDAADPCFIELTYIDGGDFFFADVDFFHSIQPATLSEEETRFSVLARMNDGRDVQLFMETCVPLVECVETPGGTTDCGVQPGEVVNPYVTGIAGNWRAQKSYLYLTGRRQDIVSFNTGIREDGTFAAFNPFWVRQQDEEDWAADRTGWTFTSEVTQFSPFGFELENRDALGRFSSALYGYNQALPVAVASNARLSQVASDNFEDYDIEPPLCELNDHWNFKDGLNEPPSGPEISLTESHSGLRSIRIPAGGFHSVSRDVIECDPSEEPQIPYVLRSCDCLDAFSPAPGRYVVSAWVKVATTVPPVSGYEDVSVGVQFFDANGQETASAGAATAGAVIDGWQRIDGVIEVPAGTARIEVFLLNQGGSDAFFDDIRIHPFNSNMKSFVYDPVSLRLLAELDENNYATFYEYDEEGALIRVKKETERGTVTIQESRNSGRKTL